MDRGIFVRVYRLLALAVALVLGLASPAAAWKPKTHIYLAELARADAIDDGKVTIHQVDDATGKVVGVLGSFQVDSRVLAALREKPDQFRAGVVGPDAYPDMVTGQQLIHPGTNMALMGEPLYGELPSTTGVDAWMTHLWRLGYGRLSMTQQAALQITDPRGRSMAIEGNHSPAIRAFIVGYLTHAAGDMFMHTFVNHYAGGDFALKPDPRNAVKHIVLEGYVGTRTPPVSGAISIDGVDGFIYREMVNGRPGGILYDRLLQGAGQETSLPAIFSRMRADLQRDVDSYERSRLARKGPERLAYAGAHGPLAEYKKAWIDDIDDGLAAWPGVSHRIAQAAIYNPQDSTSMSEAKSIATDYMLKHVISMVGVPDAVIAPVNLIMAIIDALPSPFAVVLDKIKKALLDWMVESATGMTPDEWSGYLKDPAHHFDKVMNAPGGGYGGRTAYRTTLAEFNKKVLFVDDPGTQHKDRYFEVEKFAPAFNTVQMTKLAFLSDQGMKDLLAAMSAKGGAMPPAVPAGKYENAMLGFLRSIDADNEWQGADGTRPFFLARGKAAGWKLLFMRQIGQTEGWPDPNAKDEKLDPEAEGLPADDAEFRLLDDWAVRLDEVTYGAAGGGSDRHVVVKATFRNDSTGKLVFKEDSVRTLLDSRSGVRAPPKSIEFVHTDEATLPAWHYLPGSEIPQRGRISVRFTYYAGEPPAQRLIHLWTVIGRVPGPGKAKAPVDGKSVQIPVPPLNLDGTVGVKEAPPAPQAATDPAQLNALKAIEGTYLTNLGTHLTITVDGANVVGAAVANVAGKPKREQLSLKLMADGSLQGTWKEEKGAVDTTWVDLNIRFAPDNNAFAGKGKIKFSSYDPPFDYIGQRVGGAPSSTASSGDFREAGYFALKVEAAGRPRGAGAPMEVALTAKNYKGGRQGLQYNDNRFFLLASDGVEYKSDGNYYGRSGAEPLASTVWMEKGEQAAVTYVFAGLPAGATPSKLIVREGTKVVGEFPLAGLPAARGAASGSGASGGAPAGSPVELTQFVARFVSLARGADRDWEAVVAFRNNTKAALRLEVNNVRVALFDAAGETRYANGSFYVPERSDRRLIGATITLAPGQESQVRLWFPQSAPLVPSRYKVQEGSGEGKGGPIPAAMIAP